MPQASQELGPITKKARVKKQRVPEAQRDYSSTDDEGEDLGNIKTEDGGHAIEAKLNAGSQKVADFDSDEEFKSLPEFTLLDKYNYLKKKVTTVVRDKEQTETELAMAKIRWADLEL